MDEIPRRELLLALSMWNEEVERGRLTRERFERPASGAVNVWLGFVVVPLGPHQGRLVSRTRTSPSDERARRRFRAFWVLVGPFAGLTRRLALRCIKATAEQRTEKVAVAGV